jgi:hypothetical protein
MLGLSSQGHLRQISPFNRDRIRNFDQERFGSWDSFF